METREEILEALIERIAQITGKDAETITEDTPFEELNLKSVNISQITTYLEDETDVEIPFMGFKKNKTVGAAADYVFGLMEE